MADKQEWLNAKDVAEALSISQNTAGRLIKSGRIPGVKIGRIWRVKPATLQAFMRENSTGDINYV